MGKETQDNKENDLQIDFEDGGLPTLPQTPVHLVKRTHSNFLKPLEDKPEGRSRSASPSKRLGRLPLASKDRNRSGAWASIKKRQPALQADLLSNPRKLKKYGSVLGYNELHRPKSLVLKDGEDGEDDEEGELQKKLRDAFNRREETSEGVSGSKLSELVREVRDELEFAPYRAEELEYVPDGYTPLGDPEIEKLKTVNLGMQRDHDGDDSGSESGNESEKQDGGLLPLEQVETNGMDHEKSREMPWRPRHPAQRTTPQALDGINLDYKGDGLTAEELEDLLS